MVKHTSIFEELRLMENQLGGKKEVKVVNWRKMHQVKKHGINKIK